jgi:hypothetical protein
VVGHTIYDVPAVTFAFGAQPQLAEATALNIARVLESRARASSKVLVTAIREAAEDTSAGPLTIDRPNDLDALIAVVDDRRTPRSPETATFRRELLAERARRHLAGGVPSRLAL